jgi:hypothetical protein
MADNDGLNLPWDGGYIETDKNQIFPTSANDIPEFLKFCREFMEKAANKHSSLPTPQIVLA